MSNNSQQQLVIRDDMSLSTLGETLVRSGFFADTRQAAQAIVKILAGRELGLGPIASMTGIHVISGRISLSANLIAAVIKRSGRYDFRVTEMTDQVCTIEFYERVDGQREKIGVSTFTAEDARRAQTKNMDKYPRNMLYARAMSNGARWFTPDVFAGAIYTPEEMGASVDEDGNVIDAEPIDRPDPMPDPEPTPGSSDRPSGPTADELIDLIYGPEPPEDPREPTPAPAGAQAPARMSLEAARAVTNRKGERYGDLPREKLAMMANGILKGLKKPDISAEQREEYQYKLDAIRTILAS